MGVSWPRSGHHLLVDLLTAYFGQMFQYCQFYGKDKDCCGKTPCEWRDKIHFTKNHDFALSVPRQKDVVYLLQYRDFLPSVASEFELYVRNGNEDSEASFKSFSQQRAKSYKNFMAKWNAAEPQVEAIYRLSYERLTAEPELVLPEVLRLFDPDISIDETRMKQVISSVRKNMVDKGELRFIDGFGVKSTRKVTEFRYFDDEFFAKLKQMAEPTAEL